MEPVVTFLEGRDAATAALREALANAASGRGQLAVI